MISSTPHFWPDNVKKLVREAYETSSLVRVRKALTSINNLPLNLQGDICNIAILRTFTLENMLSHIQLSLSLIPCKPQIVLGELENVEQELFDLESRCLQSNPDIIAILWRLEDLYPRLVWDIDSMSSDRRREAFNEVIDRIENIILQYNGNAPLLISTFIIPSHWVGVVHDYHRSYGISEIVSRLNIYLYKQASDNKIKIIDIAQWIASVGFSALDQKMNIFARQPIASNFSLSYSDTITRVIRVLHAQQSKVLAVDLDNTLWGGILGEDGVDNLKIGDDYPGNIYKNIQKTLISLKEKGILLVLLSKNNLNDVVNAFQYLTFMPIKITDFAVIKVNWNEKYKNLLDISQDLNLGLDSFVFLDDQKFEQAQMCSFLPEVKVLSVTSDPLSLFNAISSTYLFDSFGLQAEDAIRNDDYKLKVKRDKLKKTFINKEEFLSNLQLKATICPVTDSTVNRVNQMISKTNQFNLTTKRHGSAIIDKMRNDKNNLLLTISLSDRFGDQGIVGLCIAVSGDYHNDEPVVMTIDSFLISCRALGRGVEDALWATLINTLIKRGRKYLKASYIPTSKNRQVSNLYDRFGMDIVSKKRCCTKYSIKINEAICHPHCIDVDAKE